MKPLPIHNVLVLGPPGPDLEAVSGALRRVIGEACVLHQVGTLSRLLESIDSGFPYQLAAIDVDLGDGEHSGIDILSAVRRGGAELPVIAVSARGDVESANRAVGAGATDFLVRGANLDARIETLLAKLSGLVQAIADKHSLAKEHRRLFDAERERNRILGESPQVRELRGRIRRVAAVPRPVLIIGERGTGKELVARDIHAESGRAGCPFVAVNCAAFPDDLLESELFGHERGAFTGAGQAHAGRFEQADGGTLFLDEIGFMSLPFQQKILRTVEYGTLRRVGGTAEVRTSARIIAATNVDLASRMEEGEFLRDLYDRIAFEVIRVPPLREREGDIEILAREFLQRFMAEIPAFRGKSLAPRALAALRRYPFPGNVRELKNIIERAAYRDTTNEITPEDIDLPAPSAPQGGGRSFTEQVDALKASLVHHALDAADGNQAEAARRLGLSYHQFRHYHRRYAAPRRPARERRPR